MKKPFNMLLAATLAAGALQLVPFSSYASVPATPLSPQPAVSSTRDLGVDKGRRLDPSSRPPDSGDIAATRADYSRAPLAQQTLAACAPSDFGSKTGSALVNFVKASTTDCVKTLFSVQGTDAYNIFREAQMVSVANAFQANAPSYPGTNATSTLQLVLFLRAGYYVQYGDPGTVGPYGPALQTPVRAGLDAFFANPRSSDVNDVNGETLSETIVLIDSADEQARYIPVYKRVLNGYNSSYPSYWYMMKSVNSVYTPIFRGHWKQAFISAVTADPSLIDTLNAFALNHLDLLSTDWQYLTSNAGRELTRFLDTSALQAKVRPLAKGLLDRTAITGPTAPLWVGVAELADYHDKAQCAYYNICNLAAKLLAAALPITHNCDAGHTIRAQQMTAAELAATCTSLINQDAYFHSVAGSNPNTPVANDFNTNIQVNAFDSSKDYQTYAGAIFGISTDNGGMYLEGDPSVVGNQARFIAYEAEWLRPTFAIWNLNHEYTHYLDGRYDMYGDFEAGLVVPNIWWVEGFAEYVSYGYRRVDYTAAITEAGKHTYPLSTLWQTTYENSNSTRIYHWGYLAVRYMVEKHRSDVTNILAKFRAGDYQGGYAYYNSTIGTRYNADFDTWLTACNAGACAGTPQNVAPTAAFDVAVSGLTVALTDRSTDADGTITARSWNFGDSTTSTATNPSHTYAAAGTYTITLTVTDNKGATASTNRTVTVSSGGGLPQCTDPRTDALGKNCQRGPIAAGAGQLVYFYIYLPAGVTSLTITTSGGTGDADLYYNPSTWATNTAYTARSTGGTNAETLTIANPAAGYRYISVYGYTAFSGLTIATRY